MRVLAIDTALAACSAAVLDTAYNGVVASESVPMVRGHAEALMPLLARLMQEAGFGFTDLDRIVVTTGPGSFTGIRVGIAAARGIAFAGGLPLIGISSFEAVAEASTSRTAPRSAPARLAKMSPSAFAIMTFAMMI